MYRTYRCIGKHTGVYKCMGAYRYMQCDRLWGSVQMYRAYRHMGMYWGHTDVWGMYRAHTDVQVHVQMCGV